MGATAYTKEAIARSRDGAEEWLEENGEGWPRSWAQEQARDERRGYALYEADWEAPPIAGYEALERDGLVVRVGLVRRGGEERVHFRRTGE